MVLNSAVLRFRVTRNSSNEILDSGKLLDSGTRIRVMKYSGPKRKKIFFHILPKCVIVYYYGEIDGKNWK